MMNTVLRCFFWVVATPVIFALWGCGSGKSSAQAPTDTSPVHNGPVVSLTPTIEYADSGMVVELKPDVLQGIELDSVSWQQTAGPSAYIQNPNSINANIVLPFVAQPEDVVLTLQLDIAGQAQTLNKIITVLPLERRLHPEPFVMAAKPFVGEGSADRLFDAVLYALDEKAKVVSLAQAVFSWRSNTGQLQLMDSEVVALNGGREGMKLTLSAMAQERDSFAVLNVHFEDGHIDAAVLLMPATLIAASSSVSQSQMIASSIGGVGNQSSSSTPSMNESSYGVSESQSSSIDSLSSIGSGISSVPIFSSSLKTSAAQSSSAGVSSSHQSSIEGVSSLVVSSVSSSGQFMSSSSDGGRQNEIDMACGGIPLGGATNVAAVNPFAGAVQYVDPDFTRRAQMVNTDDAKLQAAIEVVAQQSTGIWIDHQAKLCGPARDGRMSLLQHLQNAQAIALTQESPVLMPVVLFDLPGRDCSSGAAPGQNSSTDEGLANYKQTVDIIAALGSVFPNVRMAIDIEPGALAVVVDAQATGSNRCSGEVESYTDGVVYALAAFAAVPNVYAYVDVAHAGWLGWHVDTAVNVLAGWVRSAQSEAQTETSILAGIATNVSEYIPLLEPYMESLDVNLSPFYNYNTSISAIDYAGAFTAGLKAQNIEVGALIDTARNGWGGSLRPSVSGIGESYRLDQRRSRGDWCNHTLAGLGELPRAMPSSDHDFIHAYTWLKPPGESDGDASVAACDPLMFEALTNSPKASEWFEGHFVQLLNNAWPKQVFSEQDIVRGDNVIDLEVRLRVTKDAMALADAELVIDISPGTIAGEGVERVELWAAGRAQEVSVTVGPSEIVIPLTGLVLDERRQELTVWVYDTEGGAYRGVVNYGAGRVTGGSDIADFLISSGVTGALQGGADGDVIIDVAGGQPIFGDDGDDWLFGDRLNGGAGNDTLVIRSGFGSPFVSGDAGNDDYIVEHLAGVIELADESGQNRLFVPATSIDLIEWRVIEGVDGNDALELTVWHSEDKLVSLATIILRDFYRQGQPPFIELYFGQGDVLVPEYFEEVLSIGF